MGAIAALLAGIVAFVAHHREDEVVPVDASEVALAADPAVAVS
jgi:hypothetical protein